MSAWVRATTLAVTCVVMLVGMPSVAFYLHGFGSDSTRFKACWERSPPARRRFFLDGPEQDRLSSARRWFPFTTHVDGLTSGLESGAEAANEQIATALESIGCDNDTPIELVGHSQGAMICLELVRVSRWRIRRARCFAGFLPGPKLTRTSVQGQRTVLELFSSTEDRYVDPADVEQTVRFFRMLPDITVQHKVTHGLGHAFSAAWLEQRNFEARIG
jgi:predicted esterase